MAKRLLLPLLLLLSFSRLVADEGMWLPQLLAQLNEAEMKKMGMRMSAEDIYSVNRGSLKDAIVNFNGGCTGELISGQSLILTNHHCGLSAIQSHSSLEHNYVEDGFWAKTLAEERPNPGMFVTFIVRIEEVTAAALQGVTADMNEKMRQSVIDQNLNTIRTGAKRESWQDAFVRAFYHGNQFYLFVTETYRDIRLVGAPPGAVGKFGADTDNWVWPRHTGDFSLFRIYASPDNKPAEYSPSNVPFKPRHFLPVSMDGVKEGDFTLVFGFPGRTNEYLPAVGVQLQTDVLNPVRIAIRDRSLGVMNAAMKADAQTRIQYVSKQAGLANSWKKWIGEILGIKATGGIAAKKKLETEFQSRVNANPQWKQAYGAILSRFEELYREQQPYALDREYVLEIAGRNIELFQLANSFGQYLRILDNNGINALEGRKAQIIGNLKGFYEDYRPEIDRKIFAELMQLYFQKVDADHISPYVVDQIALAGKDFNRLADMVFNESVFVRSDKLLPQMEKDLAAALDMTRKDPAYLMVRAILDANEQKVAPKYNALQSEIDLLQRTYMKALMEVFPERRFYPDANSTLRATYGNIKGFAPRDAVRYDWQTHLEGIMEKYVPGDYEFDVPARLRELYDKKDYGQYGENGKMPVCFIGSNHTTGGNSGSPAIDAYGNLVGLNFDRAWEGVMSDYYYDPSICRNIMVDIRYVLFIIDKYAGATNLIQEMTLVHPKKEAAKPKEAAKEKTMIRQTAKPKTKTAKQ